MTALVVPLTGAGQLLGVAGVTRSELVGRLFVALALTYLIGFEREIRGAAAGDRTFALVGVGSAVVGALALDHAPNALAGVVTGIGFIGAGVILHAGSSGDTMVRGVTTAATIYLAAAVGAAAGQGELLMAGLATGCAVFVLEIRHLRILRFLDGRRYASIARSDERMDGSGPGDA
jgi:putative Mg2+ transporter-C (MgtC) family protein